MSVLPFSIIVIANRRRPPIITDWLDGLPHHVYWAADYDEPPTEPSRRASVVTIPEGPGAYRCFQAHQDATLQGEDDGRPMLIFEDDARPNVPLKTWLAAALCGLGPLENADVVSLHGRRVKKALLKPHRCASGEHTYYTIHPSSIKGESMVWVQGALAYLITQEAAHRLRHMTWERFPIDLVLPNDFRFVLLHPSPFDHDRRHGSLVEGQIK